MCWRRHCSCDGGDSVHDGGDIVHVMEETLIMCSCDGVDIVHVLEETLFM